MAKELIPIVLSTSAPAVTDDIDQGYRKGQLWLHTTGPALYICSDNTNGAAVWNVLASGAVTAAASSFALTGDISPTALGAHTNDWAPTGLASASTIRASASAAYNVTGLTGGADGRLIIFHNVGSFAITLKDADGASTAANRFALSADVVVDVDQSVLLQYDATTARWRCLSSTSTGGGSGGDLLATLLSSEVAVTTTTTLTGTAFGKMHLCSGTTSNYAVTLPAASGNAGKIIGFRMAPGLTKLVTLDGNSSELIDGETTRVMWKNEVAILECDGTGWIKIAGKSIPMVCEIRASSTQTLTSGTEATLTLGSAFYDPASMADVGNSKILIRRNSTYLVRGYSGLTDTGGGGVDAAGSGFVGIYNDAASPLRYGSSAMALGDFPHFTAIDIIALTTTDAAVYLRQFHNLVTNHITRSSPFSTLRVEEQPTW